MRPPAISLLALLAVASLAKGQFPSPRLGAISPPGGQVGTTFDITLSSGADLDEAHQLLFSQEGITAAPVTVDPAPYQTGPQTVPGQFKVTIAPDTPPGVYELRAVGRFGVSTPRAFVVGDQPEVLEAEPNNDLATAQPLPINTVVSGTADGEPSDFFRFEGKAGDTYVIDCWAYRIDSKLDATVLVLDADGRELARGRDDVGLDPRLVFRVPADGPYFVRLHDFTYQGGVEHFYRLTVCDTPQLEFAVPPAGFPGATQSFTLYGYNLPGGTPVNDANTDGKTMERLTVEIPVPTLEEALADSELGGLIESNGASVDQFTYRFPSPRGVSNPLRIGLASAAVVLEERKANDDRESSQTIALPCEVAGQFMGDRDVDWYAFEAKQGETYWIEVIAARLGQAVDAELTIEGGGARDAQPRPAGRNRRGRGGRGNRQAGITQGDGVQVLDDNQPEIGGASFRTSSSDPTVAWTAPKDGVHRIAVRNLFAAPRSGGRLEYRLCIRPARPDFRLIATMRQPVKDENQLLPGALSVRQGGQISVRVLALRKDGFNGPIQLSVADLPEGVTASPVLLGSDETSTFLPLTAAEDAAPWCGNLRIVGTATIGDQTVTRPALGGDLLFPSAPNQLPPARPRVTTDTTLAVLQEAMPFQVTAGDGAIVEVARNAKAPLTLAVTRRGEFKGNVVVRPQQLPRGVQLAEVTVAGDQPSGTMELTVAGDAPLGEFSIPLQTEATISYRRNPEAAERAATEKLTAEKIAADAATAAMKAEQAKQAAEAKVAATDAAAADYAQVVAERDAAVKAATDAAAAAQAAEQAKQATAKRAEETAAAAQPKDINVLGAGGTITIRVVEAPSAPPQ